MNTNDCLGNCLQAKNVRRTKALRYQKSAGGEHYSSGYICLAFASKADTLIGAKD